MHEHLPRPDHLGPDPEPLGTERFLRAIGGPECISPAGVLALVPVRDAREQELVTSEPALAA